VTTRAPPVSSADSTIVAFSPVNVFQTTSPTRTGQDPAVAPSIVRRSSLASLTSDGRGRPVPDPFADLSKLLRMARTGGAKVQLCGRLVVKLGAQRAEEARHDTMFAGDCS
jgi:hypothetical protein